MPHKASIRISAHNLETVHRPRQSQVNTLTGSDFMMLSLRKNEEIVGGIYSYLAINCMVDIDPPNYMTNIPATDEPISHTTTDTEELDFWH